MDNIGAASSGSSAALAAAAAAAAVPAVGQSRTPPRSRRLCLGLSVSGHPPRSASVPASSWPGWDPGGFRGSDCESSEDEFSVSFRDPAAEGPQRARRDEEEEAVKLLQRRRQRRRGRRAARFMEELANDVEELLTRGGYALPSTPGGGDGAGGKNGGSDSSEEAGGGAGAPRRWRNPQSWAAAAGGEESGPKPGDEKDPAAAALRKPLLGEETATARRRHRRSRLAASEADGAGPLRTAFTFVKGTVGAYVFYLPHVFADGGLAFAMASVVAVAAAVTLNMLLLLRCRERLSGAGFDGGGYGGGFGGAGSVASDLSVDLVFGESLGNSSHSNRHRFPEISDSDDGVAGGGGGRGDSAADAEAPIDGGSAGALPVAPHQSWQQQRRRKRRSGGGDEDAESVGRGSTSFSAVAMSTVSATGRLAGGGAGSDGTVQLSFGDIGYGAMGSGGRLAVDASLVLSQLTFCVTYFVFVSRALSPLLQQALPEDYAWAADKRSLVGFQAMLYVPLSWIRKLKFLGVAMFVANFSFAVGLLIVSGAVAARLAEHGVADGGAAADGVVLINPGRCLLFVGSITAAFAGTDLLIPIQDAMAPRHRRTLPRVLCLSMTGIAAVFVAFGALTSLAYGAGVPAYIVSAMAATGAVGAAARAALSLSVLLTYPLQLFPAVSVLEQLLFARQLRSPKALGASPLWERAAAMDKAVDAAAPAVPATSTASAARVTAPAASRAAKTAANAFFSSVVGPLWRKNVLRALLVAATAATALAAGADDAFDGFVALASGLSAVPLALVYPAAFFAQLFWWELPPAPRVALAALLMFGVSAVLLSTLMGAAAAWV